MTEEKFTSWRRPEECPKCGKGPVAWIMYGLPAFTSELDKELKAGKVVLGGCCVSDTDPEWQCTVCDAFIYKENPYE